MILDLRYRAKLDGETALLYDEIASKVIKSYNDVIESCSKQHSSNIDWWVSNPASRNTLSSPIFHYFCAIAMVQELLKRKSSLKKIITDSKNLTLILKTICDESFSGDQVIVETVKQNKSIKSLFFTVYSLFVGLVRQVFIFCIVNVNRFTNNTPIDVPITIIDTFIIPQSADKDHYYPGIIDSLEVNEKKSIYFVPLLYGYSIGKYLSTIRNLISSEKKYLFKEEYLKFNDYFFALAHYIRSRSIALEPVYFECVDVTPLVIEDLRNVSCFESIFVALLNYRFAKRLSDAGVHLKTVIDWFENQMVDKGWNAGFRKFYPNTTIKGYVGFFPSKYYLCAYPTPEEYKSRVIPQQIMVMGRSLIPQTKQFCSYINVCVAPSFRFKNVWQDKNALPASQYITVLAALPMMKNEALHILRIISHAKNNLDKSIRFWIKPHPTMTIADLKDTIKKYAIGNFKIVENDFNDCIEKSDILISNASSSCMESIAKGVPVIIIPNCSGLTENTIPKTVNQALWRICHSHGELVEGILKFKQQKQQVDFFALSKMVKEEYFEYPTVENKRSFLGLT